MKTIEVTVAPHGDWWGGLVQMRIPRGGSHAFDQVMFERLTGITVNGRTRIRISFARARRKPRRGRG